jgi:hypothetical protein
MRTTVELPDELLQQIKFRALEERITLKDFLVRAAQHELERPTEPRRTRLSFPLIHTKGKGVIRSMTNAEIDDLSD